MLIAEYDYDTDIAVQRRESLMLGIQQGRREGLQQGFLDGKKETARFMKLKNFEVSLITEITGLSQAEIEAL